LVDADCDTLRLYYGAADHRIALTMAKISTLQVAYRFSRPQPEENLDRRRKLAGSFVPGSYWELTGAAPYYFRPGSLMLILLWLETCSFFAFQMDDDGRLSVLI
jgi:hypothetical protein